jgi:hypothetical protein
MEQVDEKIVSAMGRAAANTQAAGANIVGLGPLSFFDSLFPPKHAASLQVLGAVRALPPGRQRLEQCITLTLLVNTTTEGNIVSQGELHAFYNAMMHFESASTFRNFMQHGHSVIMTVPTGVGTSNLIAACSFIINTEGIFVDAIAVSDGRAGCFN